MTKPIPDSVMQSEGAENAPDQFTEFAKCLARMSHSRAGWDYQIPPAQRAEENRVEREALARARTIWTENFESHDLLREIFDDVKPLATMDEIIRPAA